MPKRTNAFQDLVAIIHSKLGPDWSVNESVFLCDGITGENREVDVVAKTNVGGYDIYLSIECRDHGRPADVTWIESMSKKHEGLATSKLVLWSRSGFSKSAIIKATALKIDTVSQVTVGKIEWAKLARSLSGGLVELVTPKFTAFIDVQKHGSEKFRLEDVSNSLIYDQLNKPVTSIPLILEFIANSKEVGSTFLDHAPVGKADFYLEMQPPIPWFVDTSSAERLQIFRIGFGVSTLSEHLPLDTASALVGEKVATLASANATVGRLQLYVEETADGSEPFKSAIIRKH